MPEQFCYPYNETGWSFEQLREKDIKSSDLARWNAPVNTIDEYERFLQTANNELSTFLFCNCTSGIHFGLRCQYSFDSMNKSFTDLLADHFAGLSETTPADGAMMNDADMACYKRDTSCWGSCLDWRQICNGIVGCINGEDEVSCDLLEFNECRDDEYRCRSGHCVPLIFAFDFTIDCADGSDEQLKPYDINTQLERCYWFISNMLCDDHNSAWMSFPCGDGQSVLNPFVPCSNQRHMRTLQHFYDTNDRTLCWQYMVCAHGFEFLFSAFVNCTKLCRVTDDCIALLVMVCLNSTTIFPSKPVMLRPFVYFVYWTDGRQTDFFPYYICYTECDHLYLPSSKRHGYSCRTLRELNVTVKFGYLHELFDAVQYIFAGCITKTKSNITSLEFLCPLTSQIISRYRVKDGFNDCHLALDETFNGTSCAVSLTQRFQCWTSSDECIPLRFVQNGEAHCSDRSDEFYPLQCVYGMERACDYMRGLLQISTVYYQFEILSMYYI